MDWGGTGLGLYLMGDLQSRCLDDYEGFILVKREERAERVRRVDCC